HRRRPPGLRGGRATGHGKTPAPRTRTPRSASQKMRAIQHTISIDEARQLLASHVRPTARTELVPLARAAGRIASADVKANVFVPPFSRSAMDGYAVVAADTTGASRQTPVTLPITERVFTGNTPVHGISRGACSEIATGAPLPDGSDAVVMFEETRRVDEQHRQTFSPVSPGHNIGPHA